MYLKHRFLPLLYKNLSSPVSSQVTNKNRYMKKMVALLFAAGTLASCNSSDSSKDSKAADAKVASASTDEKMDYAYTIEHPDQWEWGTKENSKLVLASLKGFETGNMEMATKDFADTIQLMFDGYEAKLTRDSAKNMFMQQWQEMKNLKVDMEDFESVKSKDGKYEYVSLWYKQKWQDAKGAWDSVSVMDDLRIKDGKITMIDEK